ncbi:MAG: roadblock/LC7 domain-containing protein [Phormidesmis sp.]
MAIDTQQLDDIVRNFVVDTSHVQGAALVSPAGLSLAGSLPEGMAENRVAAMAAAAMTIGDRIGDELQRGSMQYILFSGDRGYSFLTLCGPEALFLVLTSCDVKEGILMIEVQRTVEEMARIMRE